MLNTVQATLCPRKFCFMCVYTISWLIIRLWQCYEGYSQLFTEPLCLYPIVCTALFIGFIGTYCKVSKCNPEMKCKLEVIDIVICHFNKQEQEMIISLNRSI